MTPHSALERGLEQLALGLPASAREQLLQYLWLLAKWNRIYNLTAIRDPLGMVSHHLLDSLAVLPHLPAQARLNVIDIGSGGGLPGVPLAIARPNWHIVLLDSNHKKAAFLRQVSIELPLPNVEVVAFSGMLVEFAHERGAKVIIKGLRAVSDFEYEFQMALMNRRQCPDVETVFMMTGAEHSYLSSSIVKEIARLGGSVEGLVPNSVGQHLREKLRR